MKGNDRIAIVRPIVFASFIIITPLLIYIYFAYRGTHLNTMFFIQSAE